MNINPILNDPDPEHHTWTGSPTPMESRVFTSIGRPHGVVLDDRDIWHQVDWDGSCVIATHEWSEKEDDWVQIKP